MKVEIISKEVSLVKKNTTLYPVQSPVPLGKRKITFTPPSHKFYSSSIYSESPIFSKSLENFGWFKIVNLFITHFLYYPVSKTLYFIKELKIKIRYKCGESFYKITDNQRKIYEKVIKTMILNSGDIDIYSPILCSGRQSEYEEVIITSSDLSYYFRPLVEWRTKSGVKCTLITTEEIYPSYPG